VIKAAQALSSGVIRITNHADIAIIAEVKSSIAIPTVKDDRTFADLGYEAYTDSGYGTHYAEIRFYIPPGFASNQDAVIQLMFAHSSMLDYERSGMVVFLNDQVIGSVRFSAETSQITTFPIKIPLFALRPGINRLLFVSDLYPVDNCSELVRDNLWITYSPESLLHIPLAPAQVDLQAFQGLHTYPYPFTNSPTLSTVAFVLPQADITAWKAAVRLASDLGVKTNGNLVELSAYLAHELPVEIRQSHDLLVVGKASELDILAELYSSLPAPFEPGSDLATERSIQVTYRISPGTSLGYLEILPAPWATSRTILAVLGSTDAGLEWAAQALTISQLSNRLSGDFAVINGEQIISADSRLGLGTHNISATAAPSPESTPVPAAFTPTLEGKPDWLIPAFIVSSLLTITVVVIAVVLALKKQRHIF